MAVFLKGHRGLKTLIVLEHEYFCLEITVEIKFRVVKKVLRLYLDK